MIRGVRVWLPPAAKTNLRSRPASLFLHVLINEGSSNIGEVGLCWGRNHLFGRRGGHTFTRCCVWYRIIPSQLITPWLFRSVPEALLRYSKLPDHHANRNVGRSRNWHNTLHCKCDLSVEVNWVKPSCWYNIHLSSERRIWKCKWEIHSCQCWNKTVQSKI